MLIQESEKLLCQKMYAGKKGTVSWTLDKTRLLENVSNKTVTRLSIFKKNENNTGNERAVGSRA